ncbi:MAG: response regulator [Deltaproteobacteria bacterium]|nr:response regulator [Deltaproteobacteria bacterium]MBN2670707.1 response regulator [Deltaproteobacteria bacterium]
MKKLQKQILVIDDEQSVLLSIASFLEDLDYIVYTAENGKEGLNLFFQHEPDMVLVDLYMPGVSGEDVIEKVHQISPHTPIIVISGTGVINEAIDTLRRGAWDFLSKPLNEMRLLTHAVEKAFERQQLLESTEKYQQNLEEQVIAHTEKLVLINEALKVSEEKYRSYIEESPDAIFVINAQGKITKVNSAATTLTGFSKEELLGTAPHINADFARQRWGHLFTHIRDILTNHKKTDEILFVTKNNELIWLGFTAARMPQGDFIGFFRDITERKVIEQEGRKRQETQQMQKDLAAWLSVCPDLQTAAQDMLGQLAWLNEIDCGSLFMVSSDSSLKLIAQHNVDDTFWEMVSGRVVNFIEKNIGEYPDAIYLVGKDLASYRGEHAIQKGIQFAGIVPLRYGGEIEAVLCVASKSTATVSDMTKEVIESIAALTSVAIARLEAEKEMREAKQHAEEANRLKSRFVSNVSHELRTPLNGIIGFSEFIMASKSIDEVHENARTIIRESEVLLNLINSLLDHAKMEEGKLELNPEIMNLHTLLDEIARSAFLQAHKRNLNFDLVQDEQTPKYVLADSLRIRQILNNLVSNALKFTTKGSITIKTDVVERKDSESTIRFSVIDTGIGIAKNRQNAIFDSFIQADSGTARRFGGTGLGTTISLQLVKLMNGEMGLESELNNGSEFWFTLTLPTPAYTMSEQAEGTSSVRNLRPIDMVSGTILLAEDYVINQKVICNHLEQEGFHAQVVENGKDAVELANEKTFSLILMDVNMPIMDGIEAATLIRTHSVYNKNTPILSLTASAEPETREACLRAGMNDVITKPVKRSTFLGAVYKWFVPFDGTTLAGIGVSTSFAPEDVQSAKKDSSAISSEPTEITETGAESTILDSTTLLEQFGGNRQLAQTMVNHFRQTVDKQLLQMEKAISTKDLEQVRAEAHKIKGGAGSVAAFLMMEVAKRLEDAAKAGGLNDVGEILKELVVQYDRLKKIELEKILQ